MWIEMLDTYVGGVGTFPKGHKFDLAPDILSRLPKDSYKKTRAPWDEHKDEAALQKAELTEEVNKAVNVAKTLAAEATQAKKEMLAFNEQLGATRNAAKAVKKKDSKSRAAQKIFWQHRKAEGQYEVLLATRALKQMEVDDALCEAEKLTKAAEAEARKQAEEKAKAEAKAKAKAMAKAKEVMKAEAAEADAVIEAANRFAKKKEAEAKAEAELNARADAGLKDVTGKLGLAGQAEVKDE